MPSSPAPRIAIEDLPEVEILGEEEMARTFGAGRFRLGIEQLESRDLMAASLTANLSSGFLRIQGTPGADQINVRQDAGQISVQGLTIQTAQGTASSVGAGAVSRIEIDGLGGNDQVWVGQGSQALVAPLLLLPGLGNDLFYTSPTASATSIGPNVMKFARAADGTCYSLSSNNTLYLNGQPAWANTQDFALAPDSTLYWLSTSSAGGLLQKKAPGGSWVTVAPNTVKFAIAPDGTCYSLMGTNSTLYVNGQAAWGNTQDFALAPDGTLYWLSTSSAGGLLQKKAPGGSWVSVAPNTVKFAIAPDGTCYSLMGTNNTLYVNGQAGWANTQDFALAPDGTLYWLSTTSAGGLLQMKAPGGSWVSVAPNTVKFAIAPDGTCYSLMGTNSTLYVNGQAGWANTQDFALAPDGTLYWLSSASAGGLLQKKAPGGSWVTVAPNTVKFAIAPDGTCYSLMGTNSTLYVNGQAEFGSVMNFVFGINNQSLILTSDGHIHTFDGVHNWVDQGITNATAMVQGISNQALILTSDGRIHTFDGIHNWVDQGVTNATAMAQGINNQALILTSDGRIHTFDGTHNWVDQGITNATAMAQGINNQALILTSDGRIHTFDGTHNWVDQGITNATAMAQGINNQALILTSDRRIHTFDGTHNWVDQGITNATAMAQGINNQALILTSDGRIHSFDGIHNWVDQGITNATAMVQGINNQTLILTSDRRIHTFDGIHNWVDQGITNATAMVQGINNQALILTSDGRIHTFDGIHNWVDQGIGNATTMAQGINNQALILTSDGQLHTFDGIHNWVLIGQNGVVAADGSIWFLGTATVDSAGDYTIYRLSSGVMTSICVTSASIGSQWLGMGGPGSAVGLPTGNSFTTSDGGVAQHFQNGGIYYAPWTGPRILTGPIWAAYLAQGAESGALGLPVSAAPFTTSDTGTAVHFQNGGIYYAPWTGPRVLTGPIWTVYLASGAESSALGLPVSAAPINVPGGNVVQFQYGVIYWTAATGANVTVNQGGTVAANGTGLSLAEALNALETNASYLQGYFNTLNSGGTVDIKNTQFGQVLQQCLQKFRLGNEGTITLNALTVQGTGTNMSVYIDLTDVVHHNWTSSIGLDSTTHIQLTVNVVKLCEGIIEIASGDEVSGIGDLLAATSGTVSLTVAQLPDLGQVNLAVTINVSWLSDLYSIWNYLNGDGNSGAGDGVLDTIENAVGQATDFISGLTSVSPGASSVLNVLP